MEMVIPPRDHGPSSYRYTWDENGEVTQVTRVHHARPFSTSNVGGRQTAQWPFQSIVSTATEAPDLPSRSPTATTRTSYQTIGQPHRPTATHSVATSTWHPAQLRISGGSRHVSSNSGSSTSSSSSNSSSSPRSDIVPDYVVSFLRSEGATASEAVSRSDRGREEAGGIREGRGRRLRQQSLLYAAAGSPQHRGVDFVASDANALLHRSRAAEFEGFQFGLGGEHVSGLSLGRVDSREGAARGPGAEEEQRFLGDVEGDEDVVGEKGIGGGGGGSGSGSGWSGLRDGGWRAGMALNVVVMFSVLITGFACLIAAISGLEAGRSDVFIGACETARRIDYGLHAAIGMLVVVLVAGANYAFQVLSSPTRDEVSAAHRKGDWLDIGVPSLRNLGRVEGSRTLLAVVVLATALCTQVMYNSVLFVSQTAPDWKAAVVSESFLGGTPFAAGISNNLGLLSRADLVALQQQAAGNELVRLSTSVCMDQFSGAYQQEYSAVLLVSDRDDRPLVQTADRARGHTIASLDPEPATIQHCLAQRAPPPTCEIHLNASLLGSVALLNSIAVVSTAAVLFRRSSSFRPLATLGDAISSFLEESDPTTQGACLLSKVDVLQGRWPLTEAKYWVPRKHYWVHSVSVPHWIVTSCIWAVPTSLAAAGLAFAITHDPATQFSAFGRASPHALLRLPPGTPAAAAAVVASLPQLLLALLYLAANSLLTTYFLSHESSLFATAPPRPLRVSADPVGAQRASLHLTLPRPVSGLLMALFMAMSFVLSQGFFAVAVRPAGVSIASTSPPADTSPAGDRPAIVALGVSGVGLLALVSALAALAVCIVGLGLCRAPPAGTGAGGNPMALPGGSCSAVLSARCHALAREKGLWRRRVMWGVVREGAGLGVSHCGFTAGRAGEVGAGRNYA